MHDNFTKQHLVTSAVLSLALLVAACSAGNSATPAPAANAPTATTVASSSESAAVTTTTALTATAAVTTATTVTEAAGTTASAPVAMTKLNLNTVTGDELLATIPDFGNRMVREFEEYRPYVSIQQFRQEIGKYVDDAQIAIYEEYVYVPIAVNDADAATLLQIPGVDPAAADTLMAARPYASNAAFLAKLAEVAPTVDGALAQAYLEAQE